jgi:hypothetical protein
VDLLKGEDAMNNHNSGSWGHCMHCRYFGSPADLPLAAEEAYCQEPELSRFRLTVFGTNGCTAFELRHGLSRDVEESHRIATT